MIKRGFTLIELLVVISIISLLSSILLVSLNQARSKSKDVKKIALLIQIRNAVELYEADHGTYPIKTVCIPLATGPCNGMSQSLSPELDKYIKIASHQNEPWYQPETAYAGGGAVDGSGLWYFSLDNGKAYKISFVGIEKTEDIPATMLDDLTFQGAPNCEGKVASVWSSDAAKTYHPPIGNFPYDVMCL